MILWGVSEDSTEKAQRKPRACHAPVVCCRLEQAPVAVCCQLLDGASRVVLDHDERKTAQAAVTLPLHGAVEGVQVHVRHNSEGGGRWRRHGGEHTE